MEGLATATMEKRQVRPGVHLMRHGDDAGLFVEFYTKSIKMEFESEKENRYIGKDVPFIKILYPGDRTKSTDRPAKLAYLDGEDRNIPLDNKRFPHQWEAFSNQQEQVQSGTPLEEWSILSKSEVLELKSVNIHTVDQLAAVPDSAMTWLGSRELVKKAKAFLAQAKDGGELARLVSENLSLKTDMDFLKEEIKRLGGNTKPGEASAEPIIKKKKGE